MEYLPAIRCFPNETTHTPVEISNHYHYYFYEHMRDFDPFCESIVPKPVEETTEVTSSATQVMPTFTVMENDSRYCLCAHLFLVLGIIWLSGFSWSPTSGKFLHLFYILNKNVKKLRKTYSFVKISFDNRLVPQMLNVSYKNFYYIILEWLTSLKKAGEKSTLRWIIWRISWQTSCGIRFKSYPV